MMNRTGTLLTLAALVCMAASLPAGAATVTQALWRMGEDDPGAAAGNVVNTTGVDSSGSNNLTFTGTGATYTTPGADAGSPLAVNFNGNGRYTGSVAGMGSDFGVEMWLRTTANGNRYDPFSDDNFLFYTDGGNNLLTDVTHQGPITGAIAFTDNTWFHVAVVTVGGETTVYANGVAQGPAKTYQLGNNFVIGGAGRGLNWLGDIDHVRVFEVTGTFDPQTDLTLSIPIPEPATMSLLALGGLAALIRRRKA